MCSIYGLKCCNRKSKNINESNNGQKRKCRSFYDLIFDVHRLSSDYFWLEEMKYTTNVPELLVTDK